MKKLTILLIAVLALALALAACDLPTRDNAVYEITSEQGTYTVKVGDTLDFKTLFSVTNKTTNEGIVVTDSMIEAPDADLTTAGMFTVTCRYGGAMRSVIIVVEPASAPAPDETTGPSGTGTGTPSGTGTDTPTTGTTGGTDTPTTGAVTTGTPTTATPTTGAVTTATPTTGSATTATPTTGTTSTTAPSTNATTAPSGGGSTPTPSTPTHAGTSRDPYSVADALIVLSNLKTDASGYAVTNLVYVQGIVTDEGTISSSYTYFNNIVICDEDDPTLTLNIRTANPSTDDDYLFSEGDTILLDGYLRITSNAPAGEMGSKDREYTYFTIVAYADGTAPDDGQGGSGGGSTPTPTEKMPVQVYIATNHVAGENILSNAMSLYNKNAGPNDVALLANGLPSKGTYQALVVPVEFDNDQFTADELEDLGLVFNGTAADTGWNSVKTYYQASSYGALNLGFDIVDPIRMSKNYTSYDSDTGPEEILAHVLETLEPMDGMDLSDYDTDGDGYIDAVYLVYSAPYSTAQTSNLWAFVSWYYGEENETYDGVGAHYYLFASVDFMYDEIEGSGEYAIDGLKLNASTYIHETGHLLGLDDYYDYDTENGSNQGLGYADMMDATVGDHNPYSKLMLGWVTPTVITSTETVNIEDFASSGQFLMILLDYDGTYFSEYLLIDLYTATGVNALHASINGSFLYDGIAYGARIYHVSSSIDTPYSDDYYSFTDNNNSVSEIPLIKLIEADGDKNFETAVEEYGDRYACEGDLWQSGDVFSVIQPNYTRNDNKLLNFDISFDSVTADSMTVTVTFD